MDRNGWDTLTLSLWSVFFAIGLVPEPVFRMLRELARVPPSSAFVNSSLVITLALSGYFAFFVLRRCRDAGASESEAQNRAVQAGVLALIAFLEIPTRGGVSDVKTLLQLVYFAGSLSDSTLKMMVYLVGFGKLAMWLYLYSLVIRFHAFGQRDAFMRSWTLLPAGPSGAQSPGGDSQSAPPAAGDGRTAAEPGELEPEEFDKVERN